MGKKKNHRAPVPKNAKTAHRRSTHTPQNLSKHPPTKSKNSHQKQYQQKATPIVPYGPSSKILLVGEGDFSFSVSLLTHHLSPAENSPDGDSDGDELNIDEGGVYNGLDSCNPAGGGEGSGAHLIATSYDTGAVLLEKYPQAAEKVKLLQERGVTVLHGVDITRFDKLPKMLRKRKGGFDAVGFMFPHVGGLSTDVERQVKSNQGQFFLRARSVIKSQLQIIVLTLFCTPHRAPPWLFQIHKIPSHAHRHCRYNALRRHPLRSLGHQIASQIHGLPRPALVRIPVLCVSRLQARSNPWKCRGSRWSMEGGGKKGEDVCVRAR